jgi:hypothetical protein
MVVRWEKGKGRRGCMGGVVYIPLPCRSTRGGGAVTRDALGVSMGPVVRASFRVGRMQVLQRAAREWVRVEPALTPRALSMHATQPIPIPVPLVCRPRAAPGRISRQCANATGHRMHRANRRYNHPRRPNPNESNETTAYSSGTVACPVARFCRCFPVEGEAQGTSSAASDHTTGAAERGIRSIRSIRSCARRSSHPPILPSSHASAAGPTSAFH